MTFPRDDSYVAFNAMQGLRKGLQLFCAFVDGHIGPLPHIHCYVALYPWATDRGNGAKIVILEGSPVLCMSVVLYKNALNGDICVYI